jgi:hypothetical protein
MYFTKGEEIFSLLHYDLSKNTVTLQSLFAGHFTRTMNIEVFQDEYEFYSMGQLNVMPA